MSLWPLSRLDFFVFLFYRAQCVAKTVHCVGGGLARRPFSGGDPGPAWIPPLLPDTHTPPENHRNFPVGLLLVARIVAPWVYRARRVMRIPNDGLCFGGVHPPFGGAEFLEAPKPTKKIVGLNQLTPKAPETTFDPLKAWRKFWPNILNWGTPPRSGAEL